MTMINRLNVWRTLSDGSRCKVGELAQNRQGIFFQYHVDYIRQFSNLAPFTLNYDAALQLAPKQPHNRLHGVFADSLPDGWGLLLMDRMFRQADILAAQITPMDRLAFIANRGIGALSYEPVSPMLPETSETDCLISTLGLQAQSIFDGQTTEVLAELVKAGASGGARPKAQLYLAVDNNDVCSTNPRRGTTPFLVKFTSNQLALGHQEGICEAVYLSLAKQAGIDVPNWRLLPAPATSAATQWLAIQRFDVTECGGRLHLLSACGLLDADFRTPGLDYEDLIKASTMLTSSPAAGQAQFRRAMFNLFALNQDDHSKNWAFLQTDNGQWRLAPFYDVTYSPTAYGEHATSFVGFGKNPSLKAVQKMAEQANFANWKQAQTVIEEVIEAISEWAAVALQLSVTRPNIRMIEKQLNTTYHANKSLL